MIGNSVYPPQTQIKKTPKSVSVSNFQPCYSALTLESRGNRRGRQENLGLHFHHQFQSYLHQLMLILATRGRERSSGIECSWKERQRGGMSAVPTDSRMLLSRRRQQDKTEDKRTNDKTTAQPLPKRSTHIYHISLKHKILKYLGADMF